MKTFAVTKPSETIEEAYGKFGHLIGKKVSKCRSGQNPKPFKSGLKVNTVKGIALNINSGLYGFTFMEDDSIVDCRICSQQL